MSPATETPQLQSSVANISQQYEYASPSPPLGGGYDINLMMADVLPLGKAQQFPRGVYNMAHHPMLRKVQQFLVDPNDNIPLDKRVLFEGEVFLTDESDQELIYRVPVQDILMKHNEYRVQVRDKQYKDKEVFLEPARIRDLRLTTVTIAQI